MITRENRPTVLCREQYFPLNEFSTKDETSTSSGAIIHLPGLITPLKFNRPASLKLFEEAGRATCRSFVSAVSARAFASGKVKRLRGTDPRREVPCGY
jgi:hypothetical protein